MIHIDFTNAEVYVEVTREDPSRIIFETMDSETMDSETLPGGASRVAFRSPLGDSVFLREDLHARASTRILGGTPTSVSRVTRQYSNTASGVYVVDSGRRAAAQSRIFRLTIHEAQQDLIQIDLEPNTSPTVWVFDGIAIRHDGIDRLSISLAIPPALIEPAPIKELERRPFWQQLLDDDD